jgi:FMN phosphatase YigB (HAD superfamily)
MKAFLFDLDGTLLLSDEESFYSTYFELLGKYTSDLVDSKKLLKSINDTFEKMTFENNEANNYQKFMVEMSKCFGNKMIDLEKRFEEFYNGPFKELKKLTRPNIELIKTMRNLDGLKVLATNPMFPEIAIRERMKWAELKDDDFTLVTFMENSHYLKPNPKYFLEITGKIGVKPQECTMIGNDPVLDGACEKTGVKFVLVGGNDGRPESRIEG